MEAKAKNDYTTISLKKSELLKRVKIYAIEHDVELKDLIEEIFSDFLKRNNTGEALK